MTPILYLYGFVPTGIRAADALRGIDDRPVRTVAMDGFSAVVSDVDAGAYGEEEVAKGLKDLHWVGLQGLAHERVVTSFVDSGAIVPVRLLTLFSNEHTLREHAEARGKAIRAQLERFRTATEWDLKVSFDAARLRLHLSEVSTDAAELERRIAEASPGRRYLLTRQLDDLARSETSNAARRMARELLRDVRDRALDVREVPIPGGRDELPVVLNVALLVERERERELREAMAARHERLEEMGLHVAFSGPWAPYRFVDPSDPEPMAGDDGP